MKKFKFTGEIKKGLTKVTRKIGLHGCLLLTGFVRVLLCVSVAKLAWTVAYGFTMIRLMEGYAAVSSFLACAAGALVTLGCVYSIGRSIVKKEVKK